MREEVWAPEAADLAEQASGERWPPSDASQGSAWQRTKRAGLPLVVAGADGAHRLRIPASWQLWPNARLMYCPRWSQWWIVPFAGRRAATAIFSASTTSSWRMWGSIAHPTIRRLNRSCTAERYSPPSPVLICMSAALRDRGRRGESRGRRGHRRLHAVHTHRAALATALERPSPEGPQRISRSTRLRPTPMPSRASIACTLGLPKRPPLAA